MRCASPSAARRGYDRSPDPAVGLIFKPPFDEVMLDFALEPGNSDATRLVPPIIGPAARRDALAEERQRAAIAGLSRTGGKCCIGKNRIALQGCHCSNVCALGRPAPHPKGHLAPVRADPPVAPDGLKRRAGFSG